MSFLSDELVTEHDYLLLERRLRELFPKLTVALRTPSMFLMPFSILAAQLAQSKSVSL